MAGLWGNSLINPIADDMDIYLTWNLLLLMTEASQSYSWKKNIKYFS